MNCPNCQGKMNKGDYQGIEVETCEKCGGMWFETKELSELEEKQGFSEEDLEGTVVANPKQSRRKCPVCAEEMESFNYRFYDLELDHCPQHGFFLDSSEADRVEDLVNKEMENDKRAIKAQNRWRGHLQRMQRGSFWDKINDILLK